MLMHHPLVSRSFVLTIPRCLDNKCAETISLLEQGGICAEPFLGLDADTAGLSTKWTYDVDNPGTNYHIGRKTLALYLGHLMIYQACLLLPGDAYLIMEDDVRFDSNWKARFDSAIDRLPHDWDLIYMGACCTSGRQHVRVADGLFSTNYVLCTHAIIFRKKALPVIIDGCRRIYAPLDIAIAFHCIPTLKTFVFLPQLASQLNTVTPV